VKNLSATLTGKTACSLTGDVKQEEHRAGDALGLGAPLYDYKCGESDQAVPGTACAKPDIDRRKLLGKWKVQNDTIERATVTHIYNAFPSGSVQEVTTGPFAVFTDGSGTYDFCKVVDDQADPPVFVSDGMFDLRTTTDGTRVCPPPL
jgi:hypothetical protein